MRISPFETRTILQTARREFGEQVEVWLFGSRTDDARHGGDLDLMVIVDHPVPDKAERAARFAASLQWQLGDQKIDVIIDDGESLMPVHRSARQTGMPLRC